MKIGIVGSGPAGLTAAISLKRKYKFSEITVFEHMEKCAKKLLASGNGKGNVSNIHMDTSFYNTNKIAEILKMDVIGFLNSIGVITKTDKEGRIYPYTEQASTVVECLKLTMYELGIQTKMEKVVDVSSNSITTFSGSYYFDKIIIASGGKSSEFLGSDGSMFRIVEGMGHKITELRPALCPIVTKETFKDLAGLRCKVLTKVYNGEDYFEDTGELLFKEDGISGIVVFQISSFFARSKFGTVTIDFFPDYDLNELATLIKSLDQDRYVDLALMGIINRKLISHILGDTRGVYLREVNVEEVAYKLKNFKVHCIKNYPFVNAQITVGGIPLSEVDYNLQSKLCKNVYFAGEILDVDGLSGGYNMHFAFASGIWIGEHL